MKLVLHNLLQCNKKSCNGPGYPLHLTVREGPEGQAGFIRLLELPKTMEEMVESAQYATPFNRDVIKKFRYKIDYSTLQSAATAIHMGDALPPFCSDDDWDNDDFLRVVYLVLFTFDILWATLRCPACSNVFDVRDGIPNMILEAEADET